MTGAYTARQPWPVEMMENKMEELAVWGFRNVPPFAQGLVRDLRVRWALEEAGRTYESRLIGLDERIADSYRRKHPFGMVPVVESGGEAMIESGAIVYSIAEESDALMPADRRAETLSWMFVALNTVEPPVDSLSVMDLQHSEEEWAKLRRPAVVDTVKGRLRVLSKRLDGHDYLLGRFTAADILMVTVLRLIRHTNLVAEFPAVDTYLKRCEARPAFQKALSAQMADYERHAPVAA
jgi:glutathione S-transferase